MANEPRFGERAEYGPEDVCYRHPQVHSFTLCQRCGHTICPDCQVVSAVGVLCSGCVKETQPGTAQRTARAARVTGRRFAQLQYPVTMVIIAVNVLVFVVQLIGRWFFSNGVTAALAYMPLFSLPSVNLPPGYEFEPWRMVTSMFAHDSSFVFHILFNMFALWLFGQNLERLLGRLQFAVLYLLAGLGGSLGVMFWVYVDPSSLFVWTVGASGAIFGVMAATLVVFRAANVSVKSLVVLIAVNLGIGFLPGTAISWQAHLGGMLVGALVTWIMVVLKGPKRKVQRIIALSILAVVLIALCLSYFAVLPPVFA